jgi:hypothetical protein
MASHWKRTKFNQCLDWNKGTFTGNPEQNLLIKMMVSGDFTQQTNPLNGTGSLDRTSEF